MQSILNTMRTLGRLGSIALLAMALACGGGGGEGGKNTPAPSVTVSVSPSTTSIQTGQTKTFTATVTGTSTPTVTWSVENGGGGIDGNGLYWAPSIAGTYHIRATSTVDTNKFGEATVTVTSPVITVNVAPSTTNILVNQTQTFTATVSGTSTPTVEWRVVEIVGGKIDDNGLYTAPNTAGNYHVRAASTVDQAKFDEATVTVTATAIAPNITKPPSDTTVMEGHTATFTVEATGTSPLSYQWKKNNVDIDGANTASYTTPVTSLSDNDAKFSVEVTNVTATKVTSSEAKLTVTPASSLAGSNAYGVVPSGLPGRLAVGLISDPGDTWMKDSGVKWDMRYRYFTKGWRNNWGYDSTSTGRWGLAWMRECDTQGFIPTIQYYCMNQEPGGLEDAFYAKTKNATTMASYFDDFKVLMQRAKEFGKPVLVMLEGDGFAYMEIQSGENPNAPSAIASSGMAELQGLPNTAAGWGLAFLKIRKAVGASNVILGMHISAWATQQDISYGSITIPLQPEIDKAYTFLSPLGLAANVTGETYDVLLGDPLDRDSDFYWPYKNQDRWWDASDTASINSKSFNRYAEWLRLWNQKARKRWVLWQIPLGNSNHLNVFNNGRPREGYKDNRPEYFFGNGTDHLRKFADAGVIALLFGPGAAGQSSYKNDQYTDGQPFMKSRAGTFLNGGGLPISTVSH